MNKSIEGKRPKASTGSGSCTVSTRSRGAKRAARGKFAVKAVALSMCAVMAMPFSAWAASIVSVEGTDYTKAANGNGHEGGTWAWNGANDMTFNDYVGGPISAVGDLDITANGTNIVDSPVTTGDKAISVTDGDLSITGDELTVKADDAAAIEVSNGDTTITDVTLNAESTGSTLATIGANGNINISGSTVNATMTNNKSDEESSAIYAAGGNVNITNGSNVTASATNEGTGTTVAVYAAAANGATGSGQVSITDSTVEATATGADTEWVKGIGAFSSSEGITPHINITRSNVEASGSGYALLCWSRSNASSFTVPPGTITITDSTITSPANAGIQDIRYVTTRDTKFFGQTIGTGTGIITALDSADIVKSVSIKANENPAPVAISDTFVQKAYASTGTQSTAQTGDLMASMAGTIALVAAATALLAGAAWLAKRRSVK